VHDDFAILRCEPSVSNEERELLSTPLADGRVLCRNDAGWRLVLRIFAARSTNSVTAAPRTGGRSVLSSHRFSARVLDPSRTRTCVALVLAAAARPAVAHAPRTRRPHIGTRARPRPEDRLPPATRRPARYPRGQAGNDPP